MSSVREGMILHRSHASGERTRGMENSPLDDDGTFEELFECGPKLIGTSFEIL
jgi:hypothetical protein